MSRVLAISIALFDIGENRKEFPVERSVWPHLVHVDRIRIRTGVGINRIIIETVPHVPKPKEEIAESLLEIQAEGIGVARGNIVLRCGAEFLVHTGDR